MSVPPPCQEKMRLLVAYQEKAASYTEAVGDMARGHLSSEEFDRLRHIAEKTRRASVEAREQLNHHIGQHGC